MQTAHFLETSVQHRFKIHYLLFRPRGYQARGRKRWPLLLFLHGAGERGSDLEKVAVHGPPKIVRHQPDFPFIVVSPQCPHGRHWTNEMLWPLLDAVMAEHKVATNRVYATGMSMGGYGTWNLATEQPERFAAIAPICGGGDVLPILMAPPKKEEALRSLGVWAFHGGRDDIVPPSESERMMTALREVGCSRSKLTLYPEADHDSWTQTYDNPRLYEWFLKHRR